MAKDIFHNTVKIALQKIDLAAESGLAAEKEGRELPTTDASGECRLPNSRGSASVFVDFLRPEDFGLTSPPLVRSASSLINYNPVHEVIEQWIE